MKEWIKPEIMAEFQKTELIIDEYLGDWEQQKVVDGQIGWHITPVKNPTPVSKNSFITSVNQLVSTVTRAVLTSDCLKVSYI